MGSKYYSLRWSRGFCILVALTASECESGTESDRVAEAKTAFETYLFDFWRDGNEESIRGTFNASTIYHYNGEQYPGDPDSHIESLQDFGGAFTDLTPSIQISSYTSDGGGVATTWTGRHTGELCGANPTNRTLTWSVNYLFRMEAGRIVELWETWDEAAVLAKLGVDVSQC